MVVVLLVIVLLVVAAGGGALVAMLRRQAALGTGAAPTAGLGAGRRGIDPFTIGEPWRRFVQDALRAQNHFGEVVGRARAGPLRDRLGEIGRGLDRGVGEVWATAQQGQSLKVARRRMDPSA